MSTPTLTQRNEVFNQQAKSTVVSSRYDLSSTSVGSWRMGVLYPIYCRNDITPGDKFDLRSVPFMRFLPMISPAFTNCNVDVRYFFVPYRQLWSKWKPFISPSSADDVKIIEPFIPNFEVINGAACLFNVAGSLYDYMGESCIPWSKVQGTNNSPLYGAQYSCGETGAVTVGFHETDRTSLSPIKLMSYGEHGVIPDYAEPLRFSIYPYLAYNSIWNEYYRDENLQDEKLSQVDSSNVSVDPYLFHLLPVNWEKDYFSSALPWVTQSIFSTPTVINGMSIEALRAESALTRWLELQAVGGHRYQESILTHFGVNVPDEAAQIPVYLGGLRTPVQIQSVEQTSPSADLSPLASLGGKATAADSDYVDKIEFKEHGVVIGVMCIRPQALYADVTPKYMFACSDRHDYLWPEFVNLGDEAVFMDELNPGYVTFESLNLNTDFGYQMRYASYRTSFDQVHGQLRPDEPLESWTQARSWLDVGDSSGTLFGAYENVLPINSDFIQCRPSNRIFAVTNQFDNLVGSVTTIVDAIRPVPSYVDPKID